MRSRIAVLFMILTISLLQVSCDKYNPGVLTNPTNCELCSYADNVVGTYRGERIGFNLLTSSFYSDSLTITLEQVFLNNNLYDDSTSIYFIMGSTYDTNVGITYYDTVTVKDETGKVMYEDEAEFWIRNDSIYYKMNYSSWGGSQYMLYEGIFLKQ